MLKTVKQHRIRGKGWRSTVVGLHWHMHNPSTGIILRQKSHWSINGHLSNEGQEWKIGHAKERAQTGGDSKRRM
jgi:hypothetical protein